MSYKFTPLSDEELELINLVEEGIYNFEVVKSTHKLSKAMNEMAEIQFKIWDKEGNTHFITDYLVFSNMPLNIKKVKHFCDAVGLQEAYKSGSIPEELTNLSGKVKIVIKEGNINPSGGVYPKKNNVDDYIKGDDVIIKKIVNQDSLENMDIPF